MQEKSDGEMTAITDVFADVYKSYDDLAVSLDSLALLEEHLKLGIGYLDEAVGCGDPVENVARLDKTVDAIKAKTADVRERLLTNWRY